MVQASDQDFCWTPLRVDTSFGEEAPGQAGVSGEVRSLILGNTSVSLQMTWSRGRSVLLQESETPLKLYDITWHAENITACRINVAWNYCDWPLQYIFILFHLIMVSIWGVRNVSKFLGGKLPKLSGTWGNVQKEVEKVEGQMYLPLKITDHSKEWGPRRERAPLFYLHDHVMQRAWP